MILLTCIFSTFRFTGTEQSLKAFTTNTDGILFTELSEEEMLGPKYKKIDIYIAKEFAQDSNLENTCNMHDMCKNTCNL